MSFFVSRATTPGSLCRADVFARGDVAVLVAAEGERAERLLDEVRDAVLDPSFDLRAPPSFRPLLARGPADAVIVVLAPDVLVHASAGTGEAWLVGAETLERVTGTATREALADRLIVATPGVSHEVPEERVLRVARTEKLGRAADALVALARGAAGVLVAER